MKINFIKTLLGLSLSVFAINGFSEEKLTRSLTELTWKNRIILVENDPLAVKLLEKNMTEINERDIVWFVKNSEKIHTNYTAIIAQELSTQIKQYFKETEKNIILLGKDGQVKLTNNELDLATIFALIDTMPMRIQEMKSLN